MNIEWWMIDGIVCLIVAVAALRGIVRGVGDTVIRILGIAAGATLSVFYSNNVRSYLMQTKMKDSLHDRFFVMIRGEEAAGQAADAAAGADAAAEGGAAVLDPSAGTAVIDQQTGTDPSFTESLSKSILSMFDNAADKAAEAAADRLTEIAVNVIAYALIILAVTLAVAIIRMLLRSGRNNSFMIGFTDRVLGMVLGVVRGLLLAWIAVALLIPLTTLWSPESAPAMIEALQKTTIAKVLYDVNPLLIVIKYTMK